MVTSLEHSYRALFAIPRVGRLLIGMQIARIAQSMVSIAIVLFALTSYDSTLIAGLATFCSIFPGLLLSPIAGALLDRHGRARLVVLDYLIALGALGLLGVLAYSGNLASWLLIAIAAVTSLTAPLSATGLRSLLPLIVPAHLWERVNAIDSTGYVIATVVGPPLAAGLIQLWGGAVAFSVIGLAFGSAAIIIAATPDVPARTALIGPLLTEAWEGLMYTWRNPTLRGLGFSISILNIGNGTLTIIAPFIVLERLHLGTSVAGLVIAVQGLAGMISAVLFGRMDSRNRERMMLALPMAGTGVAIAMLLRRPDLTTLILVMVVTGFLNGPLDIALFTLRQRRTDPGWMGRAFAVSMAFNYMGVPVGSGLAGLMAARSLEGAIALAVVACLISGAVAAAMITSTESSGGEHKVHKY
jgi:MFS family permease